MRYSTSIERVFRKRPDGLWQEYLNHFVHMTDVSGNKASKLDKTMMGRVYKEANANEHSMHGEAEHIDVNTGAKLRLVALSNYQQG